METYFKVLIIQCQVKLIFLEVLYCLISWVGFLTTIIPIITPIKRHSK